MKIIRDVKISYEEALKRYRANLYTFRPPPVCVTGWSEKNWIRYVSFGEGVTVDFGETK